MNYPIYLFDAYGTLFDVHSVQEKLHAMYPDKSEAISQEWRSRQVHYFMVRQLIDDYRPFDDITKWALIDALAVNNVSQTDEDIKELMEQYKYLRPYPEVMTLTKDCAEKQLTIFSNGTLDMLNPLLTHNRLEKDLEVISVDENKVYKPHPEAYRFALDKMDAEKDDVLFFSSNPWDIAGAASYGLATAWVNRNEQKWPELGISPNYNLKKLTDLSLS
ncbi:haloacid dehalogenase type II [Thalassobacillus sp. CUG 92003]|uniref:haloacid dehalogenase type II n=1 Tax=Thalassobacillus sp. CUG 92003 TaxID=2736641 RepID=UPI0015E6B37E|nr:haloacid dehalogenase type II [Thalassobacillus sp. CUG 92003]